ncbi:uncharacterized protein V6R79_014314 [Siganus canaliculatus]
MSEILNVSARTVSRRLRLFHLKRTYATISDDELDDVIRETVAYRVARPNSMWHLHGNHKIIRLSTVNTKMALKNLISTKVDITTSVPTPLRVAVLKIAETPRVISWTFDDLSVKPAVIKKNKTAVITDGQSLAKITLYEGSGSRLEEGGSYVMRGHSLRGRGPPYFINVARNTMFFRGPAIKFSEELMADVETQINPSSSVVHLEKYTTASSLVTVQIKIIEVSAIQKVKSGEEVVPLTWITVKQDLKVTTVCLWREAANFSLNVGEAVSITDLKPKSADHGWFLQSTAFTKGEDPGTMQVLAADGQVFRVSVTLWEPFDQFLQSDIITANLEVDGNAIQSISTINLEE